MLTHALGLGILFAVAGLLLLVVLTLMVFVEVVMRFGFNTGFLWIQEATLHLSAWMVLIGASYGIKVGSHIGVDAVVKLLAPGTRRIVSMVAVLLCLVYCGLFLYGGWVYLHKMYLIGIPLEDIDIPTWVAHSIMLIGFILLAIRFLQLLFALGRGTATGFNLADEAAEALKETEESEASEAGGGRDPQ